MDLWTIFNNNNFKKRFGFTLSEVLITLAIIGVIAALTIPQLVANYQKQQTVEALKKVYSSITQVVRQSSVDNGSLKNWDWASVVDGPTQVSFIDKYIGPYLGIAKKCSMGSWDAAACRNVSSRYLDKTTSLSAYCYPLRLSDGTDLCMYVQSANLQFYVDINGSKPPNLVGKDIFLISIITATENPVFYPNQSSTFPREWLMGTTWGCCNKDATPNAGLYCSQLIFLDNWQIKDDYPW